MKVDGTGTNRQEAYTQNISTKVGPDGKEYSIFDIDENGTVSVEEQINYMQKNATEENETIKKAVGLGFNLKSAIDDLSHYLESETRIDKVARLIERSITVISSRAERYLKHIPNLDKKEANLNGDVNMQFIVPDKENETAIESTMSKQLAELNSVLQNEVDETPTSKESEKTQITEEQAQKNKEIYSKYDNNNGKITREGLEELVDDLIKPTGFFDKFEHARVSILKDLSIYIDDNWTSSFEEIKEDIVSSMALQRYAAAYAAEAEGNKSIDIGNYGGAKVNKMINKIKKKLGV